MTDLTADEKAWLESRRRDAERQAQLERPSRSLTGRIHRAGDKWATEAAWVAAGLVGATATLPPASNRGDGPSSGRGAGPSDPVAAVLHATYDQLGRLTEKFAHLTGPCPLDGTADHDQCCGTTPNRSCRGRRHDCPPPSAYDIAGFIGAHVDPSVHVDALMGTPTSSRTAYANAVGLAAAWHTTTAAQLAAELTWRYQQGAEPSELETWTVALETMGRRMADLAGQLADWSGRRERRCACGCGGAAPAKGKGATSSKCTTAAWRARQAG